MSDLRPCPFCGSATGPKIWDCVSSDFSTGKSFWIYCGGCGVTTPHWPSTEELVKRWNTRATEDRLAKDLGEAKSRLRHVCEIMATLERNDALNEVLLDMHAYLFPESTAVREAARIAQEKKP